MSATCMRRCQYSDLLPSSRHFLDSAYQVRHSPDRIASQALERLDRQEIGLIITNMRMPGTSIIPGARTNLAGGLPKHVRTVLREGLRMNDCAKFSIMTASVESRFGSAGTLDAAHNYI